MAINNFFLINNIEILTNIIVVLLVSYCVLLVLDCSDYLRVLIIFELIILFLTLIFITNISECVDHIVLLFLVIVGGESCVALTIIFPFIIK
jgi:hypothetical protein